MQGAVAVGLRPTHAAQNDELPRAGLPLTHLRLRAPGAKRRAAGEGEHRDYPAVGAGIAMGGDVAGPGRVTPPGGFVEGWQRRPSALGCGCREARDELVSNGSDNRQRLGVGGVGADDMLADDALVASDSPCPAVVLRQEVGSPFWSRGRAAPVSSRVQRGR